MTREEGSALFHAVWDHMIALFDAIEQDNAGQVESHGKWLAEHRVPIDKADGGIEGRRHALTYACEEWKPEAIKALLRLGASVRPNDRLENALFYCVRHNDNEVLEMFIEHGADVNQTQAEGWTPLMRASLYGRADIVKTLIKHHADMTLKNTYGFTAYDIAQQRNSLIVAIFDQMELDKEVNKNDNQDLNTI